MTYNINEVRERLAAISGAAGARVSAESDDIRTLLADHARLAEELRKVNSGETASVRFDLSPAAKEGAVRDQLVAMGWTPPGVAPAIDLEQFLELARRWEDRYSPVPGCRATAGALDATQDCAAELRALIYDLSKSPYGELRPHDLVVESWPPRTGFQLSQPHGIKLTHKPTGTVVTCDTERSQHANREKALEMLRIKLQLTKGEGE